MTLDRKPCFDLWTFGHYLFIFLYPSIVTFQTTRFISVPRPRCHTDWSLQSLLFWTYKGSSDLALNIQTSDMLVIIGSIRITWYSNVVVWRLEYPLCGTVWEGCGTCGRRNRIAGNTSPKEGFNCLWSHLTSSAPGSSHHACHLVPWIHAMMGFYLSGALGQSELFILCVAFITVFYPSNEKVVKATSLFFHWCSH